MAGLIFVDGTYIGGHDVECPWGRPRLVDYAQCWPVLRCWFVTVQVSEWEQRLPDGQATELTHKLGLIATGYRKHRPFSGPFSGPPNLEM
jgi:hypothetical protein